MLRYCEPWPVNRNATMPGVPLLYSGQEACLGKRLEFFLGYFRIGYGIHEDGINLSLRYNPLRCTTASTCFSLATLAIDRLGKLFRCGQKKLPH